MSSCTELLNILNNRVKSLAEYGTDQGPKRTCDITWRKGFFKPVYTLSLGGLVWTSNLEFLPHNEESIDDGRNMNLSKVEYLVENWDEFEKTIRAKIDKLVAKNLPKDCCSRNKATCEVVCKSMLETLNKEK